VLYLEGYRLVFWGTTVFGVRFPSALAGCVSLVTCGLLGRALLPRGGGALAVLALAGLRWHLILSRWGWNMIVLVPIVDVAALLLVRARRRGGGGGAFAALAAGAVAGLGAHVYLSAWVAGAALFAFALFPVERAERGGSLKLALLFSAGFAAAAAPIFLFQEGRPVAYFARTSDHNLALEIVRSGSPCRPPPPRPTPRRALVAARPVAATDPPEPRGSVFARRPQPWRSSGPLPRARNSRRPPVPRRSAFRDRAGARQAIRNGRASATRRR
jgi:hypothetical protein